MNMQNKLFTVQFFSPHNNQFAAWEKKFKLLAKRGFKTHGNQEELMASSPQPTPIYRMSSMIYMIWNISIGQPGLAACLCSILAPAHLLIS